MKKLLFFAVLTLKLFSAYSQTDAVRFLITTKTIGQFLISTHDSTDVVVKVDRVNYPDKKSIDFDDADVSIRIEDKTGKIYFLKNLSTTQNELKDVSSIDLPGIGQALILVYQMFPCYGNKCCSFQIFGFNGLGYFVPFTGVIDLGNNGNTKLVSDFRLKWMDLNGNEVSASKDAMFDPSFYSTGQQLYIEVPSDFILFQVKSLNYFPIFPGGVWHENDYDRNMFHKSPVFYNNSNIIVADNLKNEQAINPIKFYTIPNTLSDYKLVNIKSNTTIKLIDKIVNSEIWIQMELDGMKGYMTFDDFSMTGFEFCD